MHKRIVEFKGLQYPMSAFQVLLAQSASAEVRRQYEKDGENIFETLKSSEEFQHAFLESVVSASTLYVNNTLPHVPSHCRRLLDIGCGIGLVPLLIYKAIETDKPVLYLLDQSVTFDSLMPSDIARTGFNETYEFSASLNVTRDFLLLNGVAPEHIVLCEVGAWDIDSAEPFDCIISRKSWGFHYPIDEYLNAVSTKLTPGGVVMTDVRRGQNGIQKIESKFGSVSIISEEKKSDLIVARHA